jgi:hypothetical protein
MTIDDLSEAMSAYWRAIEGDNMKSEETTSEIGLVAFGGVCFNCQQKGHKSHECPKKKAKAAKTAEEAGAGGGGRGKFSGKCNNCGKMGHKSAQCWELEANKDKRPKWKSAKPASEVAQANVDTGSGPKVEFTLCALSFPKDQRILQDPNIWIADTAATVHTTPYATGMHTVKQATKEDSITVGDGTHVRATRVANVTGTRCDMYGNELGVSELRDVTHLPNGKFNLFSLSKMQMNGWALHGNAKMIWITKGEHIVTFDIVIPTAKGLLFAMYFRRETEIAGAMIESGPQPIRMTANEAHEKLGHADEDATRLSAKELGITITRGVMKPCAACGEAKAKQKSVPKHGTHKKATSKERRVFLDIATVKQPKNGPNVSKTNWRIMVDERTQLKFSDFYEKKNGMIEPTCVRLNRWKQHGLGVKYIRLDNAGENLKLQEVSDSKEWQLGITYEFTARDTPQQNHLAELGFTVLANRGRALMIRANVPARERYLLFTEAFSTATKLDGLMTIKIKGVTATRYIHFAKKNPAFAQYLQTWGAAGTVKTKTKTTAKLANRGVQCMFVGYAQDHTGDTYRMWNQATNGVHITRDVIWLKRMYFTKDDTATDMSVSPLVIEGVDGNDPDEDGETNESAGETADQPTPETVEEEDSEDESESESEDDEEKQSTPSNSTRSGRSVNKPSRLIEEVGAATVDSYEIKLTEAEEHYYETMKELHETELIEGEVCCVGAGLGGGFENTNELKVMKFKEAMKGNDAAKWQMAVDDEHGRMTKHSVWQAILRRDLPAAAKILTSTWAMKKKANGTYRARLNARGYEQVDGVHYDSHNISAPVTNDVTIRIVMVIMIMANWCGELLDIKGAFLHGDFEDGKNVFMEVPEGFEKHYDPMYYVLLLLQTIYGLKQSAMAFWKKLLAAFNDMKFKRSKADPCLYFAWCKKRGLTLWVSWIDDCLVVGSKKGVKKAKKKLIDRFDCDVIGNMDEYVGCKLERNHEERWVKFTQPVLLQSYEDEFDLGKENATTTPAEPGQVLMPCKEEDGLNSQNQTIYRKGTGKLLHMMRWSRPEILNPVRELSRFMKVASKAHMQALLRLLKYCVSTSNRGLLLKPTRIWDGDPKFEFKIGGKSDAAYATDTTNRRSITGYSVFMEEAPVATKCGQQSSVTLSTAESELVSGTACAQDMLYCMRILESIGLKVKKPMILEIDNKGAVGLANNWSVGGRTRHVEVRMYFLRELKEAGIIHTRWLRGEDMTSDLFTKNLARPLFEKHAKAFVGNDEYMKTRDG